jgi:uncharacterized protein with PQ loop repeat
MNIWLAYSVSIEANTEATMNAESLPMIAGTISTLMFVSSNLPMVGKAFRTKDLSSYSFGHILLSNIGNLVYWLYVLSLPAGPIWFLHGFFTVTTALMLVCYLRYRQLWATPQTA